MSADGDGRHRDDGGTAAGARAPAGGRARRLGPAQPVPLAGDGIVTVVSGRVVLYVLYRAAALRLRDRSLGDRPQVNLKLFMVGRYPGDELWRIAVAIALIACSSGSSPASSPGAGSSPGAPSRPTHRPWWRTALATLGRLWPLLVGVALCCR